MVVNLVSGILKSIKSNTKVQSLKFSTKYNSKTLCTFFFLLQKSMKTLRLYSDPKGYCRIWAIQVMCRCEGYGFQAVYSRIVYINQNVWVQNRVSFFRKLIRYSSIGGISGVYSSIGQQNSAELVLVQVKELVKGSRIPAAHLHPEIPKVTPPPPPGCSDCVATNTIDRASVQMPRTVVAARFLRRSEAAPLRSLEWRCTHYSYLTFRVGTKSYPVCVSIA